MKFRAFSIFAGIGQAIAACAVLWFGMRTVYTLGQKELVEDTHVWSPTIGMSSVAVLTLIACTFVILVYPVRLFIHRQKLDAIIVFASSLISITVIVTLLVDLEKVMRAID